MTQALDNNKKIKDQVKIIGKVEFQGETRDIEITKFDIKNDVVAFNIKAFGKNVYVGAGKDTPSLSQIQDIQFIFND